MFNLHFTYKWLHWRTPARDRAPLPSTLPDGVERFYVPTKGGNLEILYAKPVLAGQDVSAADIKDERNKSPIFFVHGGMGCAAYWLEYMTYLSKRGVPSYAISLRGHGNSWCPSYLRMVYGTTRRMLADDVVTGIRWAQQRENGEEVVLVGHSSGGGLSQFILSEQEVRVKGLALVAAVPGYGSTGVYLNWWRLDPWFTLRMILHGWHPNSPLSHPALTRLVFFSEKQTDEYVENFQKLCSHYESFLWPISMFYKFVDPARILQQISGWGSPAAHWRVLVLAGGADKIMTPPVMENLAWFYRKTYSGLVRQKKIDAHADEKEEADMPNSVSLDSQDTSGQGVQLSFVPGAGHHLQNDVQWQIGAEKLLHFYLQL